MKNKILIAGALIALAYKLGVIKKMGNLARGIRNNNPLNLRKTNINWEGKISGKDKSFETFITPEYGIRAGAKILINYQELYNLNTVNQVINRFAPASENDTKSYIDHIANELEVGPNDPIIVKDNLFKIIKTMIKHENGINPYTTGQILEGIAMV